jgi:hypothetical protein
MARDAVAAGLHDRIYIREAAETSEGGLSSPPGCVCFDADAAGQTRSFGSLRVLCIRQNDRLHFPNWDSLGEQAHPSLPATRAHADDTKVE